MKKLLVVALGFPLVLAGAAAAQPPGARECNAERVQSLVGREATPRLVETARRRSGAAVVRRLRPGQIITMEYRYDRLNLEVSRRGRVRSIRCG